MTEATNLTENATQFEDLYKDEVMTDFDVETWSYRATIEIWTVFSVLCIVLNIFSCVLIFKFKKLREDPLYKLVVFWFILNILFLLSSPLFVRAQLLDWNAIRSISLEGFCIVEQVQIISFLGSMFVVTLLTLHWYLKAHHPSKFVTYNKAIIYFIYGLVVALVISFSQGLFGCMVFVFFQDFFSYLLLLITYILFNLFMLVINVIHLCKKKRLSENTTLSVTYLLSNMYFLLHLSVLIVIFSYLASRSVHLFIAVCINGLLIQLCPVYFFIILYKRERLFNTLTKHLVSCQYIKYKDEELFENSIHYKASEDEEV